MNSCGKHAIHVSLFIIVHIMFTANKMLGKEILLPESTSQFSRPRTCNPRPRRRT